MSKTVILIDDDPDDIEVTMQAIAQLKAAWKCTYFYSPILAVDSIGSDVSSPPDFIFLDLNMPFMDGGECLEKLSKFPHLKSTIFAILCTTLTPRWHEKLAGTGAKYLFEKPNQYAELLKVVETILNEKGPQTEMSVS
jgi:CheY-like chemotaxis protein